MFWQIDEVRAAAQIGMNTEKEEEDALPLWFQMDLDILLGPEKCRNLESISVDF